jgi:subtilisin-like proprotein convertase family protein
VGSSIGSELLATDAFATLGNIWCANPEQAIPDDLPAGLASRFHLPSHGGLAGLTVSVDIGHRNVGDLAITLRHEQTGTEVVLFDRPPDSANAAQYCPGDLLDIVFDDGAAGSVQDSCVDARLAYPRDEAFQPANALAAFNGESLRGDWTLTAVDNAAGNIGILHEWCMSFTTDLVFADAFE